ncbi:MAG TPA: isoprenylcysteine carboxylmethyltransferase family protein [Mucilaginibacter sp.]|jgi:protein-S-isoprenylcysteine O-methyltransferase Ste14|nr:isoprenylcysteine carboxylmethyltransferase family protein [Mucilaginibacter sp.]
MNNLGKKAFGGLILLVVVLGLILFLTAGTLNYWQAWVYLAIFFVSAGAITLYLLRKDTALLKRRLTAGPGGEKEKTQKIIQSIAQFAFIAFYLLSGFDHRYEWSNVPVLVVIVGDILVASGFYIVFVVFKENTFTSATIEVDDKQTVISTGPYSIVRHPMYSGALIMLIGTPIALGSWWGLIAFILIAAVIIWRLLDEEKFLSANLPGYTEYCSKVRSRLIPGIF